MLESGSQFEDGFILIFERKSLIHSFIEKTFNYTHSSINVLGPSHFQNSLSHLSGYHGQVLYICRTYQTCPVFLTIVWHSPLGWQVMSKFWVCRGQTSKNAQDWSCDPFKTTRFYGLEQRSANFL